MRSLLVSSVISIVFCFGLCKGIEISEVHVEQSRIIVVPAGASLQKAIEQAKGGDIIQLQAGASYDAIVLPKKDSFGVITIRPSGVEQMAENFECNDKNLRGKFTAKVVTRGKGISAVSTKAGASGYRFVCIEFAHEGGGYVYNLVYLGSEDERRFIPSDFEFDRCVFRSSNIGKTRRGIAVNAANVIIKKSYFEGFAYPQEETQAIAGWTGTRNLKILDSYIEGGAENILFGGADPENSDLIPQDIEIRGNYLKKRPEWKNSATIKCLFELKNAKRVVFAENYLENNWEGAAFRITVRNQDGRATFSTIEDVLIENNIIDGAGGGINILGKDDTFVSQVLRGLIIRNNLFLRIGTDNFAGGGYFVQVSDGKDILIENNTVFNEGNIVTFHGKMPENFIFRKNIVGHGLYGIHGLPNVFSLTKEFQNNIVVNNRKVSNSDRAFPNGNLWVSDYSKVIGKGFVPLVQAGFDPSKLPSNLLSRIVNRER
ncbi:MAG: hypothetical protein RML33_08790 [Acidobacteriota bacterium]|nr:hypothetical protein [Pyrinomonadaceae bacterium]MDW8304913.1 hypothetical protein [Acidobacteriota bacterium]